MSNRSSEFKRLFVQKPFMILFAGFFWIFGFFLVCIGIRLAVLCVIYLQHKDLLDAVLVTGGGILLLRFGWLLFFNSCSTYEICKEGLKVYTPFF